MDAALEKRILKRLDKRCGKSGIPENAECKKGAASRPNLGNIAKGVAILGASAGGAALLASHLKNSQNSASERAPKSSPTQAKALPGSAPKNSQSEPKEPPKEADPEPPRGTYEWAKWRGRQAEQRNNERREKELTHTKAGKPWHKVLGVSPSASSEEIKAAFRKKSRETHPDVNQGKDKGFGEVNEAWEIAQKLKKHKRGDSFLEKSRKDELQKAYETGMKIALARKDADSTPVPASLDGQIVATLKTIYGDGVLGVSNSKIDSNGVVSGIFVGRSRPHESAKVYNYGIDLVKRTGRFKRSSVRDSEDEECCGGKDKKKGCGCSACA